MNRRPAAPPVSRPRVSAARLRALLLLIFLAAAALLYAGGFGILYEHEPHDEKAFAETGADPVAVYADFVSVDPVRYEIQIRLDFATVAGPHGILYAGTSDRDLTLYIGDGASAQEVSLRAGHIAAPVTLSLSLHGSVINYPLDSYIGRLSVSAYDQKSGAPRPVHLTVWPVMSSWRVGLASEAAQDRSGVTLNLTASRAPATIVMAIAIYTAMVLVGLSGLTVGGLVFIGLRKLEAALTGALGAMVFAIPVLRNAMPGAPPLGGHADVLVFLWVELAVILGLTLYVITWASRGPEP